MSFLDLAGLTHFKEKLEYEKYANVDISSKFTAAQLHSKVSSGDFKGIHIGDYFPITLNGTYKDYALYTVPVGVNYYSEAALTTLVGQTASQLQGTYQSDTAIKVTISGTEYFVAYGDCEAGYQKTMNETVDMQIAAINIYKNMGDTVLSQNHLVLVSKDLLANTVQMRAGNSKWYDDTKTNPWLGSAAYETLNNASNGIVKLVEASALGQYMFAGPNQKGMRYMAEVMGPGVGSPTSWGWQDRGKLWLPTESEVYGRPVWQTNGYACGINYNQFPVFAGKSTIKGSGRNGGRATWWLASATSATNFAYVTNRGDAATSSASSANRVPLCFIFV